MSKANNSAQRFMKMFESLHVTNRVCKCVLQFKEISPLSLGKKHLKDVFLDLTLVSGLKTC